MPLAPHRAPPAAHAIALASALMLTLNLHANAAPVIGFTEQFPGTSVSSWASGNGIANPGTGGALGGTDGFLLISTPGLNSNLGATSNGAEYTGDWIAAGVTLVRLKLKDVNTDEPLEVHFGIGPQTNFWQYNVGFIPPENGWGSFDVDLSSEAAFTQIIGAGTFVAALSGVVRILVRHDFAPYIQAPDPLDGDFGLDEILLTNGIIGVDIPAARGFRPVRLAAPYPNPSRGAVALAIESYTDEAIRIEVIDVTGRLVRSAVLAAAPAGTRIWTWDGLDNGGARTAAGVYRVRAFGSSGGTSRPLVRLGS